MASGLQSRDRRALLFLVVALVLVALLQLDFFAPGGGNSPVSALSIEAVEERLLLAQVKARQAPLADSKQQAARTELAAAEAQLLKSETSALAQAEMREIVGDLLKAEGIAMSSSQFGTVELEGEHYTQVPLLVDFSCRIEQFVNLMAAIANAPQLLATRRIQVSPADSSTKSIQARLAVAGFLPASRTPELQKKTARQGVGL